MDTSASEGAQAYKVLAGERPVRCHAMREIPDSRAPPTDNRPRKVSSSEGVDNYAFAKARKCLRGIGASSSRGRKSSTFRRELLF